MIQPNVSEKLLKIVEIVRFMFKVEGLGDASA